jgi:hypothetical protein
MEKIVIPESSKIWLKAELEASEVDAEITKGSDALERDLTLLAGKHNWIAIGRPYFQKLNSKSKHATPEVKKLMEANDFYLVSLSCSFLPDMDCKFTWAQLGLRLEANDKQGVFLAEKPIAWNLFPVEVTSPINYSDKLSISPELSFKVGKLEPHGTLFSVTSVKKWISYEPQLFSFGYRTSNIAWQFRETREKDIRGDIRDLMLIIQAPQESHVKWEFKLSAEVSFRGTVWRMFSKKGYIQDKFNLSDCEPF